jgi:uncharacterized membrane protein YvbJ
MICNKCGKEIPADSVFCQHCGTTIEQTKVKTKKRLSSNRNYSWSYYCCKFRSL